MSFIAAKRAGGRSGQVMLEYAIVAGIFVAVVTILALLLFTFKEYGGRILDLLAAEFP
ncbi:MAG: hypothetical protein KJ626_15150 [Verrucomicrobia bacterium]|nr:hypothetical protein [Verrucomicrobiota bacterium]